MVSHVFFSKVFCEGPSPGQPMIFVDPTYHMVTYSAYLHSEIHSNLVGCGFAKASCYFALQSMCTLRYSTIIFDYYVKLCLPNCIPC